MRKEEDLPLLEMIEEELALTFDEERRRLVVIQKTQFATKSKLYPKYIGPYKVIKIKPNDRYNVEKFGDFEGPNRKSCSADLMKPWITQDKHVSYPRRMKFRTAECRI
ncbi:hypothetical protein LAZ67_X000476 [Cordylochernes scorpioides]|uniref:Uncharacterized protein n=1 Tax=Cordylochernes scorpioides TaxID=51811 RepID=A0ABY6LVV1_9ARAC|nr:hypothetical protein LAZ67_X000476 [Cordylochernes scorpioides]